MGPPLEPPATKRRPTCYGCHRPSIYAFCDDCAPPISGPINDTGNMERGSKRQNGERMNGISSLATQTAK